MNQKTFRRPDPRPSSPPPVHEPRTGYIPSVVGAWNVGPGVLKVALFPYRDLPEVRVEMDHLSLQEVR